MKFFRSVSIYTLISVINSAIPFLLLPVLTRYLSPTDYGILSVVNTIVTFAFPLTVIGIGSAIYIEYFKLSREELPVYVSSALIVPLVCTLVNLLVFAAVARVVESQFGVPRLWSMAIPLMVALQVIPYIVGLLYQVREEPVGYGKYQVAMTALNFGLSVMLVVGLRWGWQGRVLGMYLAYLVFSLAGIAILVRGGYLVRRFDRGYIKAALLIGAPLIPHELGTTVINMSDRLFISKMVGLEAAGLYSLGYQVGMVVYMVCSSFNQAWAPYLFRTLHEGDHDARRSLVRKTYGVAGALMIVIPVFSLFVPLLYRLFIHEQFAASRPFVYWTAIGYGFYGLYILVVNYIYFAKKTHILTGLTVGSALVNLILNYLLVARFGAIGAAYATTASFGMFFLLAWWLSNKVCPMPWFTCFGSAATRVE
jgi:O-antigen/teichoic acid export membrane protein